MASDEDRWSEARSLLDTEPTAEAERRLRRVRRKRVVLVLSASLVLGVPFGIAAYRFSDGSSASSAGDVPTWQMVAGLLTSGVGLVATVVGLVAQIRTNRTASAWRSPLIVLTEKQRGELLAAVRGRTTVGADRLPLARYLATTRLRQRILLPIYLGLTIHWIGQAIAFPAWWRVALAGAGVVLLGVGVLLVLRQERQALRFLAQHPHPDASVA